MVLRFDESNNGFLNEEEFVKGWLMIAEESGNDVILKRFRSIAEASSPHLESENFA